MKQSIKLEKIITEGVVAEYLNICNTVRELEKRKNELRESVLQAYPEGGSLGRYLIFIEELSRRSFPLDQVKSRVSDEAWSKLYEPYISISMYSKLTIKTLE